MCGTRGELTDTLPSRTPTLLTTARVLQDAASNRKQRFVCGKKVQKHCSHTFTQDSSPAYTAKRDLDVSRFTWCLMLRIRVDLCHMRTLPLSITWGSNPSGKETWCKHCCCVYNSSHWSWCKAFICSLHHLLYGLYMSYIIYQLHIDILILVFAIKKCDAGCCFMNSTIGSMDNLWFYDFDCLCYLLLQFLSCRWYRGLPNTREAIDFIWNAKTGAGDIPSIRMLFIDASDRVWEFNGVVQRSWTAPWNHTGTLGRWVFFL